MTLQNAPSLFSDGKEPDALRTIGEVAAAFGIRQHVLRYWEQQFPMLRPLKRSGGRRYYRADDVALVGAIDRLVNGQGYTLKGARKALESKGGVDVVSAAPAQESRPAHSHQVEATSDVLTQLRSIRERLAAALAA